MTLPAEVIEAFGVFGEPQRLVGGEGNSYLVGNVVFKPAASETESVWRAEVLSNITQEGFRVAQPVKTKDGHWTYGGWEASTFLQSETVKGRWSEKVIICRKFHQALKNIPQPTFLQSASHPWAVADRMVWGEQSLAYGERLNQVMDELKGLLQPLNLPSQLIHGDMTGNILFSEHAPPAVIDFSPYWRPAEYAATIIIVDSIVWEGAPDSLLNEIDNIPELNQLLVRAAMWRIKTTEEFIKQYGRGSIDDVDAYQHLIGLLKQRKF